MNLFILDEKKTESRDSFEPAFGQVQTLVQMSFWVNVNVAVKTMDFLWRACSEERKNDFIAWKG